MNRVTAPAADNEGCGGIGNSLETLIDAGEMEMTGYVHLSLLSNPSLLCPKKL